MIFPADAPRVVELSGHGVRVRLEQEEKSQQVEDGEWGTGRAGMQYRDLIPGRLDGRYIASHIRIPEGGPVPDYVHHHDIEFQMIYCYSGWVKVVYEDQGPPFVMRSGDCVLQPPHIRHRVLECSDQMEVIEVSSPAEHETHVDHDMELPNASIEAHRDFSGQRFVRHQSSLAEWLPGPGAGLENRDLGIAEATNGMVSAQVIRAVGPMPSTAFSCDSEMVFTVVLQGSVEVQRGEEAREGLVAGDAFHIGVGRQAALSEGSNDLELLQVVSNRTA